MRGEPGAFGAQWVFAHLHNNGLPLEHHFFNGGRWVAILFRLVVVVGAVFPQVGHMQKRCALQSNVDKCRLHAGQHAYYFAQVHIAHNAACGCAFNVKFLHSTVLNNGHARFLRCHVHQYLFVDHLLLLGY